MKTLLLYLAIGGGIGAMMGRFGQCTTGACPLTANWKRGAVYGAAVGLLFYFASGAGAGSYHEPKNIQPVTESSFDAEVTKAGKPVVVDFFAVWCGPCKMLSPRLDKLAGEFKDRIKFVSVNVDHSPALLSRFNVEGIPTVLFFGKDGIVVERSVGLLSEADLRAKLESLTRN
ncbi:MAG TPA: thioredoxin [Candidatus Paceibacterota bacterium]|nr:thioredoxin [Candidatus Paceibacterota bacterium]